MSDMTDLKVQRALRPKIEAVIPLCVAVENQKNALDFVAWLRANKMTPGWSGVHNAWNAKSKGSTICKISLRNNGWDYIEGGENYTWKIKLYLDNRDKYEELIINESLQHVIWDGIYECIGTCLGGTKPCIGGNDYTVYGKVFKGVCGHSFYREIFDPGEAMLNSIKQLLAFEKQTRAKK